MAVFIAEPHQPHEQFEIFVAASRCSSTRDASRMLPRASRATLAASSVGNPCGRRATPPSVRPRWPVRRRPASATNGGQQPFGRFGRPSGRGSFLRFSMIFSSLLAACVFIRSGSRIMTALYSDSNALNDSLRMISSASNVLIFPCLLSISDGRIPHRFAEIPAGFSEQPPPLATGKRRSAASRPTIFLSAC